MGPTAFIREKSHLLPVRRNHRAGIAPDGRPPARIAVGAQGLGLAVQRRNQDFARLHVTRDPLEQDRTIVDPLNGARSPIACNPHRRAAIDGYEAHLPITHLVSVESLLVPVVGQDVHDPLESRSREREMAAVRREHGPCGAQVIFEIGKRHEPTAVDRSNR